MSSAIYHLPFISIILPPVTGIFFCTLHIYWFLDYIEQITCMETTCNYVETKKTRYSWPPWSTRWHFFLKAICLVISLKLVESFRHNEFKHWALGYHQTSTLLRSWGRARILFTTEIKCSECIPWKPIQQRKPTPSLVIQENAWGQSCCPMSMKGWTDSLLLKWQLRFLSRAASSLLLFLYDLFKLIIDVYDPFDVLFFFFISCSLGACHLRGLLL